jgi:tetratricopeptide (TPR) repeat protein/TolB-like protein
MFKKLILATVVTLVASLSGFAQGDKVLVLPFENTSDKSEFNWVGEAFADSLSDLLRISSLNVVTSEERKMLQQRLRIPLTNIPSLATSLKLARDSGATVLVAGRYNIAPAVGDTAATINVTAKIVKVNEGRFLNEVVDGQQVTRDINVNDGLGNLQTMQGQIAFVILHRLFKGSLSYSQNQLVTAANKIPGRAFEAYTKALLTPNLDARENYLKNAMRLYTEATPDGVYSDAALELGHLFYQKRRAGESITAFEQVISAHRACVEKAKAESTVAQCNDETFAEASFYIGLLQWQQQNFELALATLRPLAEDLKLTSVYNALGAIAVQAAKSERKNPTRAAALMNEGLGLFKKAAESAPDDANIRFNYAATLFLQENYAEAADQLRAAIAANPKDGDAYFMLAKAMEALKSPLAESIDNEARKYLTANNRYATLEKEWQRSKSFADLRLRVEQPARKDFVSVVLSRRPGATKVLPQMSETEGLLATARKQIKDAQDDEAMATLRRVLASEPMSAESYLLLGKIHLRRGDIEQAISSFKTSVFWDNRMIDAHISLGKIYVDRGDCQQAKSYAAQAVEINAENADAQGLQRMIERCGK